MPAFDPAAYPTPDRVPAAVDALLVHAADCRASDVHLLPDPEGLAVRLRVDGRLTACGRFPRAVAGNVVGRLKVLAGLLTYDTDRPQEGRLTPPPTGAGPAPGAAPGAPQMRLATFPTIHGEKAVVRLFAPAGSLARLDDLGFPAGLAADLRAAVDARGGLILLTGPAGSGKTTTAYALLRELAGGDRLPGRESPGDNSGVTDSPLRSLVSLEDPVEAVVPGVSQSQTRPAVGFDFPAGLRSLLRQDPEALFVGEVRDVETARIALGAALTGHLVLTTFHAGNARQAAVRLRETGAEPYQIRHGVRAVLAQRLLRRLCGCGRPAGEAGALLGLPLGDAAGVRVTAGCEKCGGSGYAGRAPVAVLDRVPDGAGFDPDAADGGARLFAAALAAVRAGATDPAEVRRVFGFGNPG